jgi:hypothetical protein
LRVGRRQPRIALVPTAVIEGKASKSSFAKKSAYVVLRCALGPAQPWQRRIAGNPPSSLELSGMNRSAARRVPSLQMVISSFKDSVASTNAAPILPVANREVTWRMESV